MIAPPSLIPSCLRAKGLAGRQTPLLEQAALADFLSEGYMERHIRRMRRLYGSRRESLLNSLRKHFGDGAHVMRDAAGTHAMVQFEDKAITQRRGETELSR